MPHVTGEAHLGIVTGGAIQRRQMTGYFASEALTLASPLQSLGYIGRASFDALLVGASPEQATIHWIECNARWGGVSIPMTAARRLLGSRIDGAQHI